MGQGMPDPRGGGLGKVGAMWAHGPKLWAKFSARMVGPILGLPQFGGPNFSSLPFAKYMIPRARDPHIQVRSTMLYRNS